MMGKSALLTKRNSEITSPFSCMTVPISMRFLSHSKRRSPASCASSTKGQSSHKKTPKINFLTFPIGANNGIYATSYTLIYVICAKNLIDGKSTYRNPKFGKTPSGKYLGRNRPGNSANQGSK